jgi:hypothetical protein
MGKPVMAQSQMKNARSHSRIVYGSLAALTGALLAAAFIAPFYGALEGPVQVITSDGDAAKPNGDSGMPTRRHRARLRVNSKMRHQAIPAMRQTGFSVKRRARRSAIWDWPPRQSRRNPSRRPRRTPSR